VPPRNPAVPGSSVPARQSCIARKSDADRVPDPKARIRQAMLTGPILSTMLELSVPTTVVLVAQTLVGMAGTFYVGFLGTDALVGVALVFPILMLMTMMSAGGIGGGVAAAVARAMGARRGGDGDALVFHALVLAIIFGLGFFASAIIFGPSLYQALGADGKSLGAAVLYSDFIFLGSIPIWIVNLMSAALRGAGNVRVPALVTLLGAIVLTPLYPFFTFGIGPWHGFGIAGAGIAVSTYYTAAAVGLLRYMATGRSGLCLRRCRLEWRLFREILQVGLISSLSALQLNLTIIVLTGSVGYFGVSALAGYGMGSRLDYLLMPLLFGLGTAVLTMVATNVGAGNSQRARRVVWNGTLLGAILCETIGILAALFPTLWLGLFSHDAQVLKVGSRYLQIVAPIYGAVGTSLMLTFSSQGTGRPLWPFLAGTVRLMIAAGIGWFAVAEFRATIPTLFEIIALSSLVATTICVCATLNGAIWRIDAPPSSGELSAAGLRQAARSIDAFQSDGRSVEEPDTRRD
jgi:putative MATE family efflux protein